MSKKAIQTRWEWSNEVKPALKWLVLVPQWWKIAFEPNLIPFRAFIWQKTRFYPLIWDKRRYPGLFPPDADFGNTFFMIPNVCGNNPEKRKFGTLSKIKWHFPLSCQNLWTRPRRGRHVCFTEIGLKSILNVHIFPLDEHKLNFYGNGGWRFHQLHRMVEYIIKVYRKHASPEEVYFLATY